MIDEIDQLLNDNTTAQIADILNARGLTPGGGATFNTRVVARLARDYHLKPRYDRLRERGMLTLQEMADSLQLTTHTVKIWLRRGLLRGHAYSDKNESLYEPPGEGEAAPRKKPGVKLSQRRLDSKLPPD